MTPGENDAAMIDFGGRPGGLAQSRQALPLQQRPAAGRTPIHESLFGKNRTAMAANPFHIQELT
jgi:hypothetical protein